MECTKVRARDKRLRRQNGTCRKYRCCGCLPHTHVPPAPKTNSIFRVAEYNISFPIVATTAAACSHGANNTRTLLPQILTRFGGISSAWMPSNRWKSEERRVGREIERLWQCVTMLSVQDEVFPPSFHLCLWIACLFFLVWHDVRHSNNSSTCFNPKCVPQSGEDIFIQK